MFSAPLSRPRPLVKRLPYLQAASTTFPIPSSHEFVEMPERTNEWCWRCLGEFDTPPIALVIDKIQKDVNANARWHVMGNFCSLCCCCGFTNSQERFRTRPQKYHLYQLEFAFLLGLLPSCPSIDCIQQHVPIVFDAPSPLGILRSMGGIVPNHTMFRQLFCNDDQQDKNVAILPASLPNMFGIDEVHINTHARYTSTAVLRSVAEVSKVNNTATTVRFRCWVVGDEIYQTAEEEKEVQHPSGYRPKSTNVIPYRRFETAAEYKLTDDEIFTCPHCCRNIKCDKRVPLVPAPIARSVLGYEGIGRFCSPACAFGFLSDDDRYRETCAPLCFEFFFLLGMTDGSPFSPAPKPFDILPEFGGCLSHEEYASRYIFQSGGGGDDDDHDAAAAAETPSSVYVQSWGFVFCIPNPQDMQRFASLV